MLESDAGHSELLFFACNASSNPPTVPLLPCSSPNLAPCSFHRQGVPIFCAGRRQASSSSLPVQSHTRMSNDSASTRGHQHCTADLPAFAECHQDFSRCVRFCHRCRLSFHGPRQDISRSKNVRASCPKRRIHFLCFPVAEAYQGLSCAPRLGWRVLDSWQLPLPRPLSAQGIVANLSRPWRSPLLLTLLLFASAATPDVTADFSVLNQCIVQQCRIAARHGPWDSEWWRVDWERVSLQSCSLIQDRKILSHVTREFTLFFIY